jgi:hypothetical protein
MKKRLNLILAAAIAIGISSCDKKDENLAFNKLDVEENKALVETSAIEAARTFDAMKDHDVIDAMVSLGTNLDAADPTSSKPGKKSKFTKTVNAVGGLGTGETGINDLFAVMAAPGEFSDDPESIQELWDEIVGTYTWNFDNERWDYEANADAIVFLFPSTTDGTSNNATLTIYDYEGVVISTPIDDEYSGDLPVSLNLKLEIDGSVVLTYTFAVEYNDDGIPSSVASDLDMSPYKFSIDITNNDKEISATYQFTNDGDIVLMLHGGVEGDFTQENIDANTYIEYDTYEWTDYQYNPVTEQYEWVTITETDEWEEVEIGGIIHTGRIKMQLYNISVVGIGNVTAIADSIKAIYPDDYWNDENYDEQAATQREADMMNEHLQIFVIDEDSRKKIADVEAYVVEDIDDWYTNYYIDFRMVFGDGSMVDLETYFEEGFEDFVAELNGIISDLNNKYDWDIDPIEY